MKGTQVRPRVNRHSSLGHLVSKRTLIGWRASGGKVCAWCGEGFKVGDRWFHTENSSSYYHGECFEGLLH
jgi:hypothetical protein